MKQLYLLRHAKSSWDDSSLADHDRPLSPRGRRAADKLAGYLVENGIRPELVLVSSSRRTRETLELVAAALDDSEVRVEPALYGATEEVLLGTLRGLPEAVGSALLLGHNPGMHDLALELAGRGDAGLVERLREKMPTAALAALSLPIDSWTELAPGKGELVGYVVPGQL